MTIARNIAISLLGFAGAVFAGWLVAELGLPLLAVPFVLAAIVGGCFAIYGLVDALIGIARNRRAARLAALAAYEQERQRVVRALMSAPSGARTAPDGRVVDTSSLEGADDESGAA